MLSALSLNPLAAAAKRRTEEETLRSGRGKELGRPNGVDNSRELSVPCNRLRFKMWLDSSLRKLRLE